jgi:hypothetical protein
MLQQRQQQRSSRDDDNAIIGINNLLVLCSTQQSTITGCKRMGGMEANDGNGQQPMMWEEMNVTTTTAEQ